MATSSVGKTRTFLVSRFSFLVAEPATRNQKLETCSGMTLIEMVVVVGVISLIVGVSLPAVTSGIDSLRLNAATTSVVSFVNSVLNRAERRQQVVEITISKNENALSMRSTEPGFFRKLELPDGVTITRSEERRIEQERRP